ncbi:hypothetical protein FE782_22060 [Paenibacillus antri]|uniref:FAD/FMN-containing dehydrogenase n=1 Tax=Paenibacillus antri TaxID=2582848 RepID=A0A5R9GAB6_9BACL|nr:hypothetical protein [Paenibacillus antri]TLS50024.1 hypothetical protein FE782_22060 [Paenibacillus antri]
MKKILVVLGITVAVSAVGTGAFAAAAAGGDNSFQEMFPLIKQMHPKLTEGQLQDMYNACHGSEANGSNMMNGSSRGMMY